MSNEKLRTSKMGLRGKLIPGDSSRFMAAGHAELLRILRNPGSQEQRCGP